ncbi:hypothetical protein IFM89_000987 [Coptis chinensis]|uniref:fructose-bisphosphate aldolase n=1 Tax=Coptis chinensis TaxID=261450 RepID=A0A835M6M6_9MAGN|nr:hypothetical protein IFM89_000987 [Coptis chinensis]
MVWFQSLSREILVDGSHDIDRCANVVKRVLAACYKALNDHKVLLKGTLLKPNMVTPGSMPRRAATINLNAMNQLKGKKPWSLSFSFGRALQQSTLKAWSGKVENVEKAQAAFLSRCKANSEATLGTYKGDAAVGDGASKGLHVKDYKY